MAHPVIALLTDFGTRDHYAGAMRGVALSICPGVTLADISHEVPPQDVLGGALELASAFKYFPERTVFLAVVDPGVGSARRGLAAEAGGYLFVAPDNGLLTMVFKECPPKRVVELTEKQYARPSVSRTFEGRDRFAPAAAWLAKGIDLAALGHPLAAWHLLDVPDPVVTAAGLTGKVLRVDRFGNLITNIDRRTFDTFAGAGAFEIAVAEHAVPRFVATYAEAEAGTICGLFDSGDRLEIAVSDGSAAERLRLGRGAAVTITRT